MTDFTDAEIRAAARDFIVACAKNTSLLDLGTLMAKDPRFDATFGPAFHSARDRIAEAMGTASVTATWPGAQNGDDADEAALLDILETGVGDGPVLVQVLHSHDGGPDHIDVTDAADSPALVEQLLAWHRGGIQAEHDRMAGQLAQLRHVVAEQAQKLEGYAQQHIADAKRIVELTDERDDDLYIMASFLMPSSLSTAEWHALLANHFSSRAQGLIEDSERFAAALTRVNQLSTATVPAASASRDHDLARRDARMSGEASKGGA